MLTSIVMNTTEDIISYPGSFIETIIPDKHWYDSGFLTHIINNFSLKVQCAFLSNAVEINTTSGLATNINTNTINNDGNQYLLSASKLTCVPSTTKIADTS